MYQKLGGKRRRNTERGDGRRRKGGIKRGRGRKGGIKEERGREIEREWGENKKENENTYFLLQIRDTTRANFPRLTIQQFGALFKAFKIYSADIVEEFFRIYVVQQDVRINDPTWHSFIGEVVLRFGGARNHFFLLDFLKSVADSYLVDKRQKEFVLDLMQLKVPKLFAIEEGAEDPEDVEKEDVEVGKQFTIFLRSYINRNALKHSILTQMTSLLVRTMSRVHYSIYCLIRVSSTQTTPSDHALNFGGEEERLYKSITS